jgi:hypothetical protein
LAIQASLGDAIGCRHWIQALKCLPKLNCRDAARTALPVHYDPTLQLYFFMTTDVFYFGMSVVETTWEARQRPS